MAKYNKKIITNDEIMQKIDELHKLISNMNEEPMNIEETARFLKYSVNTVKTKFSRREIPFHISPAKTRYTYKSELNEWIKRGNNGF
jgi:hypothetical protein